MQTQPLPPSKRAVFIFSFKKLRNVLKRMKNQFARFFALLDNFSQNKDIIITKLYLVLFCITIIYLFCIFTILFCKDCGVVIINKQDLRALSTLRGLRGAPEVPPLCRETQSLGQQMLNASVGINGLRNYNDSMKKIISGVSQFVAVESLSLNIHRK